MIATVLRVTLLNLRRDRVALMLTFVLPILFFSVFASVFSGMDEVAIKPVRTVVVAKGGEPFSTGLVDYLSQDPVLEMLAIEPRDRAAALEVVRRGEAQVAVILPRGAGLAWGSDSAQQTPAVEMVADRSNPLAVGVVRGTLQAGAVATPAAGRHGCCVARAKRGRMGSPRGVAGRGGRCPWRSR